MITLVRSITVIHGAFSLEIFVCLKIEKSYEARELVATVFVVWVIVVCILLQMVFRAHQGWLLRVHALGPVRLIVIWEGSLWITLD